MWDIVGFNMFLSHIGLDVSNYWFSTLLATGRLCSEKSTGFRDMGTHTVHMHAHRLVFAWLEECLNTCAYMQSAGAPLLNRMRRNKESVFAH